MTELERLIITNCFDAYKILKFLKEHRLDEILEPKLQKLKELEESNK